MAQRISEKQNNQTESYPHLALGKRNTSSSGSEKTTNDKEERKGTRFLTLVLLHRPFRYTDRFGIQTIQTSLVVTDAVLLRGTFVYKISWSTLLIRLGKTPSAVWGLVAFGVILLFPTKHSKNQLKSFLKHWFLVEFWT